MVLNLYISCLIRAKVNFTTLLSRYNFIKPFLETWKIEVDKHFRISKSEAILCNMEGNTTAIKRHITVRLQTRSITGKTGSEIIIAIYIQYTKFVLVFFSNLR